MKTKELNYNPNYLRFNGIIGTGGIGSGKFFVLNGDHTLGREESRSGHFLNVKDYCKQHIILHYIRVLLGPAFSVIPIGKIGDDEVGQALYQEMTATGFIMNRVEKVPMASTLFSFCFYYPDGCGGNLTTDNSASARVDPDYIEKAGIDLQKLGSKGIVMAAPEVPLEARNKLLELGNRYGLFCTASFTSGEVHQAMASGMMAYVDMLAINLDEASSVAGMQTEESDIELVVHTAIQQLQLCNNNIMVAITAGKNGSWCWDGHKLNRFPAVTSKVVSTAGAGDAFFSGLLCGIALGFSLFEAQQLATLVAGLSVSSPHTIHKGIDRHSLKRCVTGTDLTFSETILKLLEE